jgi:hypothetical protein
VVGRVKVGTVVGAVFEEDEAIGRVELDLACA